MQEWLSRGSPQRRARCHTADLRAAQAFLHPDAHQEGGLACTNKTLLEQQRLAILDLVRGRQLLWPARACVRGARRALGSAPSAPGPWLAHASRAWCGRSWSPPAQSGALAAARAAADPSHARDRRDAAACLAERRRRAAAA